MEKKPTVFRQSYESTTTSPPALPQKLSPTTCEVLDCGASPCAQVSGCFEQPLQFFTRIVGCTTPARINSWLSSRRTNPGSGRHPRNRLALLYGSSVHFCRSLEESKVVSRRGGSPRRVEVGRWVLAVY